MVRKSRIVLAEENKMQKITSRIIDQEAERRNNSIIKNKRWIKVLTKELEKIDNPMITDMNVLKEKQALERKILKYQQKIKNQVAKLKKLYSIPKDRIKQSTPRFWG
jgi:hypothetical protein